MWAQVRDSRSTLARSTWSRLLLRRSDKRCLDITDFTHAEEFSGYKLQNFEIFLNRWRSPGWRWALWDREELPLQAMTMRLAAVRAGELSFLVVVATIVCCCFHSHCYCYCDHHHHQDQCSREVAAGLGCWVPADTSGCLRPEVVAAQVSFDASKGSTRMSYMTIFCILFTCGLFEITIPHLGGEHGAGYRRWSRLDGNQPHQRLVFFVPKM